MKRTIRLTENQLHDIVENTVKSLLKELNYNTMKSASDKAMLGGRNKQGDNIDRLAIQNAIDRNDYIIPNLHNDSLYVNPSVKPDNAPKNTTFEYNPSDKAFQSYQIQSDDKAKLLSKDNNPRFASSKDARKMHNNMNDLGLADDKSDWHDFKY